MKPEAVDGMQDANQDAHHLLLERLWTEFVEGWTAEAAVRSNPAARRAVEAGANPQDVAQALRAAAYSAVFGTLHRIDSGRAPEAPPGAPGWRLIEVSGGLPTGNDLTGLDETFVRLDPSGRAGADLWR